MNNTVENDFFIS